MLVAKFQYQEIDRLTLACTMAGRNKTLVVVTQDAII
jgi:hypothetical protein